MDLSWIIVFILVFVGTALVFIMIVLLDFYIKPYKKRTGGDQMNRKRKVYVQKLTIDFEPDEIIAINGIPYVRADKMKNAQNKIDDLIKAVGDLRK